MTGTNRKMNLNESISIMTDGNSAISQNVVYITYTSDNGQFTAWYTDNCEMLNCCSKLTKPKTAVCTDRHTVM